MTSNDKLKAWFITGEWGYDTGVAVVETSLEGAMEIVVGRVLDDPPEPGILSGYAIRGADVTGLKRGHIVKGVDGIRRGCYSSVTNATCPVCKKFVDEVSELLNGLICCEKCEDAYWDNVTEE